MTPKQQQQWLWRLEAFLTSMKDQHTHLCGYTEKVVTDLDLWQKMDAVHPPILSALADIERVLAALEEQIKRDSGPIS
jgi:hypothetical protein